MDINKIKNIIDNEGFRSSLDEDGDLAFKFEGGSYFIEVDKNDAYYVRIAFPFFWDIESEGEKKIAITLAGETTKLVKAAKILVEEDSVWGSIELFVQDEDAFGELFMRSLVALGAAVQHFVRSMNEAKVKEETNAP